MNLTVKNLPERMGETLKEAATEHHRSVNAEIIHILSEAMEEFERRRYIRTHRDELKRFVANLPKLSSSVPLIREDRRRR